MDKCAIQRKVQIAIEYEGKMWQIDDEKDMYLTLGGLTSRTIRSNNES